ncbi:16S rRNA (guanine(527)-N(7))-methyltransferase RsmG [Primorskyibacter aestuariivivens]|uniref:16S rRNA (guanine(527)-N(7))-methyltransferase RsmG n=1 Tax=Primorskyibacter aestuariivivens TaxID=1888912 RepID=UPI002301EC4E|nr:16S rRNA (guanine(527)-N(7))-methyltransferase RsmG [Primorskyibacter aestuariivivens]MDA7427685.1 16S rRNA (guanine(527)-N(7))-methyltransferase RsmG [Primorskyibacter aestuariivivens]
MIAPEDFNVSRETFERLEIYVELLRKWTPRINLVAKSTMPEVWERHIADSIQLLEVMAGRSGHYADLGSGGGLPGLVTAIAHTDFDMELNAVTLVESDQRKAAFLRTVLRETESKGQVVAARIEAIDPLSAEILSARALASLDDLLGFAEQHLAKTGVAVFPKGINWRAELEEAQKTFSFTCEAHKSQTQDGAVILEIGEISRV